MPLLICTALAAFWLGCAPERNVEDHFQPSIRFFDAMIPVGNFTLVTVDVDDEFHHFGLGTVGNMSGRRTFSDGHHQIRVNAGQFPNERTVLATDLHLPPANRSYTCLLVGEIPDSGIDSTATATLMEDVLYPPASRAAIRLVNASLDRDSCDLIWTDHGDSLIIGKVAPLQASNYVPIAPGGYEFLVRGAGADSFHFDLDSTTHHGISFYLVGATEYGSDPMNAFHVVIVDDTL